MQITQTVSEDLRRQFTVTVSASELDSRVTKRLEDMKGKINLKGFRPGKAPLSHLKKQFGKSILGEVVEEAVSEGSQKAITDNALKPAIQPRVEPVGDINAVVDGNVDLSFTVTVDLMPDFTPADVSTLQVEKILADISDAEVDEAVERANNTAYGLSAGVWTDKGSRILKMSTELKAGVVWANTYNKFDPTSPFGGYKESGFGREGGRQGLLDYAKLV